MISLQREPSAMEIDVEMSNTEDYWESFLLDLCIVPFAAAKRTLSKSKQMFRTVRNVVREYSTKSISGGVTVKD